MTLSFCVSLYLLSEIVFTNIDKGIKWMALQEKYVKFIGFQNDMDYFCMQ